MGSEHQFQIACLDQRTRHLLQYLLTDFRFVGEAADPAVTGVELGVGQCGGSCAESEVCAVVGAYGGAKSVVAARTAERLDVPLFVRRTDALGCKLPAEPVGLFEQADVCSRLSRRERGSGSTRRPADDQNVTQNVT